MKSALMTMMPFWVVAILSVVMTIIGPSAGAVNQGSINVRDAIDRIKKCYSADNNQFNRCLFDFWKEVRPMLAAGIPDLNVPKLDPLYIKRMEISENGAVVQGIATFDDLTVTGLGKYVPNSVAADIRAQTITVEIGIPELTVEGRYDVDGIALLLPVKGNGRFRMKLTDVSGKAVAHVEREGTGVRLGKTDIDFAIRNIAAHVENLLGGEEVGDAINNLINDNAQEILKDVKPLISTRLGEAITKVLMSAIKELPGEAFVLPEGFVPPEGVTIPEGFGVPMTTTTTTKS